MLRARAGFIVLVAVALSVTACSGAAVGSSPGGSKSPLKIGVINPFSGPTAPGGIAITQGYELAVDEVNASGGLLGRTVEIVKGDASTPDQGISEVNRLATSTKVDLFMGTYLSGISNTASEAAARYGKLYWDTNALAANLTERKLPNFVRSGPNSASFAAVSADALAKIVAPSVGKPVQSLRVCLSHEQSAYGTSIAEAQKSLMTTAGAVVVDNVAYDPAAPDLGNVVLRCQNAKTDVWVSTGYVPDSNLLLRTALQQGFKPPAIMMVGSGDTEQTAKAVPEAALTGVFVVAYSHADVPEAYAPGLTKFLAAYKTKFGGEPTFPQTTTAYSGAKMLFEAIAKAKSTDPAAVRKALLGLDKPLGTSAAGYGEKFDENFQNIMALPTLVQWQSGKVVTVFPQGAAAAGAQVLKMG